MVLARVSDLEIDYLYNIIWSLGLLVSGFNFDGITFEQKYKILNALMSQEYPNNLIPAIPSLVFSISAIFADDLDDKVLEAASELSELYSNSKEI